MAAFGFSESSQGLGEPEVGRQDFGTDLGSPGLRAWCRAPAHRLPLYKKEKRLFASMYVMFSLTLKARISFLVEIM